MAFLVLENYSNDIYYVYNNQLVPGEYKKAIETFLGQNGPLQDKTRNFEGFGDEARKLRWKMGTRAQVCEGFASKATNGCGWISWSWK